MERNDSETPKLSAEDEDAKAQQIAADSASRFPVDSAENRLAFKEAFSFYMTAQRLIVLTSNNGVTGSQIELAAKASRAMAKAISTMFPSETSNEELLYKELLVQLLKPVTE